MKFNKNSINKSEAKHFIKKDLVINDLDFHFDDDIKKSLKVDYLTLKLKI